MAKIFITDAQIADLLQEEKFLPDGFPGNIAFKVELGHSRANIPVVSRSGNQYWIKIRQGIENHLDFSVILVFIDLRLNREIRLRRYNGKSHEHTNRIEKQKFYDFHIHTASERYQKLGAEEESFAEPTARYSDLLTAIECLVTDCGFIEPEGPLQERLFRLN